MTFHNNKHHIQFEIKFMTFEMLFPFPFSYVYIFSVFVPSLSTQPFKVASMLKFYIFNLHYSYGIKYNYIPSAMKNKKKCKIVKSIFVNCMIHWLIRLFVLYILFYLCLWLWSWKNSKLVPSVDRIRTFSICFILMFIFCHSCDQV